MDPLSIAASAASLVVITGKVSVWLCEVANSVQNVDTRISALSGMVVRLLGLLALVEKTIGDCQSSRLVMAHIDDDMWAQIEATILDCVTTIDALDRLVTDIKAAGNRKNLFRKPKIHLIFSIRADDLAEFNTKIQISNDALQISLQVLDISLSFRNQETSDAIYRELRSLKELFEGVFQSPSSAEGTSSPTHYRLNRNLQKLAQRARKFHSDASTTASTVFDNQQTRPWGQAPAYPRPYGSGSTAYGPGPRSPSFSPGGVGGWGHQYQHNSGAFPAGGHTFGHHGRQQAPWGLPPDAWYWNGAAAGPSHVPQPHAAAPGHPWRRSDGGASTSGGSIIGGLSEEQKQHINQWRAQAGPMRAPYDPYHPSAVPLNPVEESQESLSPDDATTIMSTIMDDDQDRTTNVTSPDLASPRLHTPSKDKELAGHDDGSNCAAGEEVTEEKNDADSRNNGGDDDDESDGFGEEYMADILLNCEELATEKFRKKDYARAEEFLRLAIESSTGNSNSTADFKILNMRLAICCCLQDKWDLAFSSVGTLIKTKTITNSSVFDILHAVAISHLQNSQFTDAYDTCKIALQGRKRISGKGSDSYHESLGLLSVICDKKGDSLEAEAVKHSLAKTSTLDLRALAKSCDAEAQSSAKTYILEHRTLIPTIFANSSPPPDATASGAQREPSGPPKSPNPIQGPTIPYLESTGQSGQQRALRDEKSGKEISEFDTGKIVVTDTYTQKTPEIVLSGPSIKQDHYTGQNWAQFDTGKEFYVPPALPSGINFADQNQSLAFSFINNRWRSTKFYPDSMIPFWPLHERCTCDNLVPVVPLVVPSPATRDPEWFSDLEVYLPPPMPTYQPPPIPGSFPQTPVVSPRIPASPSPMGTSRWKVASGTGSGGIVTPIMNISKVGPRPSLDSRKVISIDVMVSGAMAAISFGSGGAKHVDCGKPGPLNELAPDSSVTTPSSPNLASPISSDTVSWTDHPWNVLRMIDSYPSGCPGAFPDALIDVNCPSKVAGIPITKAVSEFLKRVDHSLTAAIAEKEGAAYMSTNTWEQVIVSVPDMLLHRVKLELWGVLSQMSLFAQGRVIPRSLAVATGYLLSDTNRHQGALSLTSDKSRVLVVLNCDDVLVEVSRFIVYNPATLGGSSLLAARDGAPGADLCGLVHAEQGFANLARQKIQKVASQFKLKIRRSAVDSICEACCAQFREHILPIFPQGNAKWSVQVQLPPGFPGVEQGFLQFTEPEIEDCLKPSVERIVKMSLAEVIDSYDENRPVTHFIAAGTYASSPYLQKEVNSALEGLVGTEAKFLPTKEGRPSAAVAGGLLFATMF